MNTNEPRLWCGAYNKQQPFDYDFYGVACCEVCGQDVDDSGADDGTACLHGDGAVMWNPYNKAVQCHKCGQAFPTTATAEVRS